ncbi:hypothetical protein [Dysgonomonas alginatilytica]|nr:hypothetical protein [Dysgonomonas alginatilytica]
MKTLKGGFDCGGGLNYYVGYCGNGVGISVYSSNYLGFSEQSAGLCKTQISN